MDIGDKEAIGIGAALAGWLGGVFMHGVRLGKLKERYDQTAETVGRQGAEIQALKVHHDTDMQSIRDFFSTAAGGQKFVTFIDHDLICDRNNKATIRAIETLTEALKENSEIVERMGDKIHILNVDVAVLKERRVTGSRQAKGDG